MNNRIDMHSVADANTDTQCGWTLSIEGKWQTAKIHEKRHTFHVLQNTLSGLKTE